MPSLTSPRTGPDTIRRFVTGGTGFMGSHFLLSLYQHALHTTVLARGDSPEQAFERLADKVEGAAFSYSMSMDPVLFQQRTKVVVGDICEVACGLSAQDVAQLTGTIDELWHLAASLRFEVRSRDEIFKHNVEGVRQVVALAARLGCKRFVYISTAYTAGRAGGDVPETLHDPAGPFNNLYEESKCLAEHVVSEECQRHGIQAHILRPSIIVGPCATLRTGGSDSGLYGFAAEIYRLRGQFQRMGRRIAVQGNPDTPLNCIPVDWVIQDLMHLVRTEFAGVGPILHLTAPHGTPISAVGEMITKHAHTPGFDIDPVTARERAPIEVLFDRRTTFYGGYLYGEKNFVRSLPSHPELSVAQIDGYIAEQYKELRGEAGCHVFDRRTVRSADGTSLCTYHIAAPQARPTVVLVNAYGMPVDLMIPLAQTLSKRFNVLTWESRGVPNVASQFDAHAVSVGHHAADLAAVLRAHQVSRAHVVGWCTGAQVALRFVSEHPQLVQGLVLLNGCYTLPASVPVSPYRELVRELMREVAAQPEFAQAYYALIYGNQGSRPTPTRAGSDTVSNVLNFTDPDLLHLTSAPFQSPEALYRYAVMVTRFNEEPLHAWTRGVSGSTLVVTGAQDAIAHPEESRSLARMIPGSRCLELPQGNHFSLYHDAALRDELAQFLEACADVQRRPDVPVSQRDPVLEGAIA